MTFKEWMVEVDLCLIKLICLASCDLEDANYRDMFDDGYSPKDAANEVLDNLGY